MNTASMVVGSVGCGVLAGLVGDSLAESLAFSFAGWLVLAAILIQIAESGGGR